jgi:two-component system cell cycle sensor histidine kinase/response regulator CckA
MARLLPPGVRLIARLAAGAARVRIDADRFHAALLNLAANAGQAMGSQGQLRVTSQVRLLRRPLPTLPRPAAPLVPPGRWAVVTLRDSGPGIPPELMARLFTPFVTTRAEGTGLGLLSVRITLAEAGGHLVLGGGRRPGLTARLFLPLSPAAAAEAAPGREVWLVEDEAPLRRLMARALREAGWRVTEADSAEAALALPPVRPARVVADLTLPGRDGVRLLRALRRRWRGLGCVLISGYESAGGATPAGTVFLRKPFALAALVAALAAPESPEPPGRGGATEEGSGS